MRAQIPQNEMNGVRNKWHDGKMYSSFYFLKLVQLSSFASAIKVVGVPCICVIGLRASIPSHPHRHLVHYMYWFYCNFVFTYFIFLFTLLLLQSSFFVADMVEWGSLLKSFLVIDLVVIVMMN